MAAGAWVIYALCDPITKKYRYIGKANNLDARLRCHKWEAQSSPLHTHKINWLRSLDCDPVVEVLQQVNIEDWQDAERRWISKMRKQGNNLTNFADGGQTSPVEGKGHTEETKVKLRLLALERGCKPPSRRGQVVTDETKSKLRVASLRNGNCPPLMGGWNKGIHKTYCKNRHRYSLENTRLYCRPDRQQPYQICKICERESLKRYLSKED